MILDIFRWFAIITCIPFHIVFFTRKTYYEDKGCKPRWRKRKGALIISNHFNFLDYLMHMFVVLPKKLNVVASEYSFRNRWIRFASSFFGTIEANRITKNMKFIDDAAELIRRGKLVIIFPEGKNTDDGRIKKFYHSYLVIAHRAGAPIIPIVTDGNYGLFKRAHIMIGKEIPITELIKSERRTPTREELAEANEIVYKKMISLRTELIKRRSADRRRRRKEK